MKLKSLLVLSVLMLVPTSVFAETKSNYDRSYNLASLKTWDFKVDNRVVTDPVGRNDFWDRQIRDGIEHALTEKGLTRITAGRPSFLVTYSLGTRQRYTTQYLNDGFGGWGFRGRWHRWGLWGPGWGPATVWRIPYTESTLVLDIIDPASNRLVWRGYDTQTIDFNKSEKTIDKAIDHLVKRFAKDLKEAEKKGT